MYEVSNITLIKKIDYCVWNVVFQMDGEQMEYTTDFLYLIKEKKWVFNSLITHELTSVVEGNQCIYCGENKIACFVASKDYQKIKTNVVKNKQFLKEVTNELRLPIEEISSDYLVVNNKAEWEELAEENRFYGNLLRIKNKNM